MSSCLSSLRAQACGGLRAKREKGIFWRKEQVSALFPGLPKGQNLYSDKFRDMGARRGASGLGSPPAW